MSDAVNHPAHYQGANGIEAADVIDDFSLGYWLGCVVKYVLRAGRKGDALEDLKKARWCLEREIQKREAAQRAQDFKGVVAAMPPLAEHVARMPDDSKFAPGGLRT